MRTLLLLALLPGATAAQRLPDTLAGRRADLAVLARELPARHPNAFANLTRAEWDSAVASLAQRLPTLRRTQWLVELQRLVATLGDAHTTLNPVFDPGMAMRAYPLELYLFEDGLFVRRAAPEHRSLLGARVIAIGTATADQAIAAAGAVISHENEWWVRAWAPVYLMIPEIVDGLGLAPDMERLPLVVERAGGIDTVVVRPGGQLHEGGGHGGPSRAGWLDTRSSATPPLRLRHPGRAFWFEVVPEANLVYVAYRAVAFQSEGKLNRAFWDEVFATVDGDTTRKLVIDIRENTGGNGFLNRHVVQQILRRPALDRPDRLFVVIGRQTFSAAQQLANELDWWTQATFVGEPTGQRPRQFGDHVPLVLPNSGVTVMISSVYHQGPNPFDDRPFVAPEIYAPLRSEHYRSGSDPALTAIGRVGASPTFVERMAQAARSRDSAGARSALESAIADPANRYRNVESEINALGYRLLNSHDVAAAITVFQQNAGAFPHSANVHDSLGEALAAAGRREEAIAAYRRALAIDPQFRSSLEALARLGASR